MVHHLHVALGARDLERSVRFYRTLFDTAPDKQTPDYARFVLASPPLVLSLNAAGSVRPGDRVQHLGIRMDSTEAYESLRERLADTGLIRKEQHKTRCCHSIQDKLWVRDPDGNDWELYDLVDDLQAPAEVPPRRRSCCEDPSP